MGYRCQITQPQYLQVLIFTAFLAGCNPADKQEPIQASLSSEPPRKSTPIPTIGLVSTQLPAILHTLPATTNPPFQSAIRRKNLSSLSDPRQHLPNGLCFLKHLRSPPLAPGMTSICSPLVHVELKDLPRVVSEGYNPPPMGSDARHQGVDFCYYNWKGQGKLEGTPAKAIFSGRVAASEKILTRMGISSSLKHWPPLCRRM